MKLCPIICKNDTQEAIKQIQDYLENTGIIRSVYMVDSTEKQVVMLVGDEEITKQMADLFWAGWQAALG